MELAKVYDELYGMIEDLRKQIGSGGGGGGIEINPAGAATDDLEKIKKGSVIYGLNYNKNANRPQVNGNLLTGNKNSKQLNIAEEMSEAAYAALSSKNENEIYFLTENAPIFTETATVAASGITWSAGEDPDTYIATLSYSVVDTDTTGVVGVTCDNELITIGDPTFEAGAVSVPMICEDPTAITGDIEFVFTLKQPAGNTRILHNNQEFSNSARYAKNYSTVEQDSGVKWIDGSIIYQKTYHIAALPNNTSAVIDTISNLENIVDMRGFTYQSGVHGYNELLQYPGSDNITITAAAGTVTLKAVTDWSNRGAYVTLFYTKQS